MQASASSDVAAMYERLEMLEEEADMKESRVGSPYVDKACDT